MSLNKDEKAIIQEALQVYVQIASQQMPQQQLQGIVETVKGILGKIDSIGNTEPGTNKPTGISDEWYDNICITCDKLGPSGCEDKVTEKFPGKCDPILHYERKKFIEEQKKSQPKTKQKNDKK